MGKNNESILGHNLVEWFNCLFTHHITAKIKSSCVVLIFNFIPIYTLLRSDVQIDFFVSFTFRKKCLESISFSWIFIFSGEWTTLVDLLNFFSTVWINFVFYIGEWVFRTVSFYQYGRWIQTISDGHSNFTQEKYKF